MRGSWENNESRSKTKLAVEAADIEGIAAALDVELRDAPLEAEAEGYSEELQEVMEPLADIYEGVQVATEQASRGRSRKTVRQYADREDLSSDEVGHVLRVLEGYGLLVQDGNRWGIAAAE